MMKVVAGEVVTKTPLLALNLSGICSRPRKLLTILEKWAARSQ
jgi:hypothetical protein